MSLRSAPRLPRLVLRLAISDPEVREGILGDLDEELEAGAETQLRSQLTRRYWRSVVAVSGMFALERVRQRLVRTRPPKTAPGYHGVPAPRRGDFPMKSLPQDFRHALRTLVQRPGFTIVAILTLALGIGATTAIFTLLDAVVLSPLPFDEQDRLVDIGHAAPSRGMSDANQCAAWHFAYEEHAGVFEDIGMFSFSSASVVSEGEPELVPVMVATSGTFRALRVNPALGRIFTVEDEDPESTAIAMLGYGYWQSRYGGDPDIVGQTIQVDGLTREIVGVMPPAIGGLGQDPSLIWPLRFDRSTLFVGNIGFPSVARLRDGVTLEEAEADLARVMPMAWEMFPGGPVASSSGADAFTPFLTPLKQTLVGSVAGTLWILLGGVVLVLLIACANVANLFLVRAEARTTEMAVRTAIGASRRRVGWEYIKESLVLGLLGGVAGLALAYAAIRTLVLYAPAQLPRLDEVSLSATVFLFALAISVGAGMFFGAFPVLRHARSNPTDALKYGGPSGAQGRERNRIQNSLAVAQMALALVLLVASGLMLRTFQALRDVDPGFHNPGNVLTLRLSIPRTEIADTAEMAAAHEAIARRLTLIPGVTSVALGNDIPMAPGGNVNPFYVRGVDPAERGGVPTIRHKWIGEGYFETLEIPLLIGRTFTWDDAHFRFSGAILSESLANEYFGSAEAAMGQLVAARPDPPAWREVVGVVADVREDGLTQDPPPTVYWPQQTLAFWEGNAPDSVAAWRSMGYALRSDRVGTPGFIEDVQQSIWSVNPNLPLRSVGKLSEFTAASVARRSFAMVLLMTASGAALILGLIGVYGVISYAVSQRSRELGMRIALGAEAKHLEKMVLRQGLMIFAVGTAVGLGLAFGVTRLMSGLLYNVAAVDLLTFALVPFALLAVALLAAYIPARRAARVDVMQVLRN